MQYGLPETVTAVSLFTKVAHHLIRQGRPAKIKMKAVTACAYRGNDGTACAVGCLIPDHLYSSELELKRVCSVLDKHSITDWAKSLNPHRDFLVELQIVHDSESVLNDDGSFDIEILKNNLHNAAKGSGIPEEISLNILNGENHV